ncbi:MAG: hypothetical protein JXA67_19920 [Micromonosporaceae bacterium]|nr:hypothetical protein [Micromonosporaceae bacterium]
MSVKPLNALSVLYAALRTTIYSADAESNEIRRTWTSRLAVVNGPESDAKAATFPTP